MSGLKMFIPITKIDAENRIVYGAATAEAPDLVGEVCDYASTKPLYQAWSEKFATVTGGKSLGNLRSMHGKIAAGKLTAIDFDDAGKRIMVAAKVVDDAEWTKVQEGVYTGFSQGGKYVKRWADGDFTRYTAEPNEISLVDMPCLPGATFEVVKAAGEPVRAPFKTVLEEPSPDAIKARAEGLAKAAGAGKTWREFAEPAFAALMAEALKAAAEEMLSDDAVARQAEDDNPDAEDDKGSGAGDEADQIDAATVEEAGHRAKVDTETPRPGETSRKGYEPGLFWDCGCPDHKHSRKSHAIKCMKSRDDAAVAKTAASPLNAALDALEAKLGIEKGGRPDPLAAAIEALFPAVAKRTFSADQRKAAAKAGAAMPDGSFPIETKADLEDAIHAYGRAKDKAKAKAHIEARAKALGAEDMLPDGWADAKKMAAGDLAKGLEDVARFTNAIQELAWLYGWAINERAYEGDSSTIPDDLCHLLRAAGEILVRWASEEVGELMPDGAEPSPEEIAAMALGAGLSARQADAMHKLSECCGAPFALLAKFEAPEQPIETLFAGLQKKGARNSKADAARIQSVHDHSMALGAKCAASNIGKDGATGDDLAKALKDENEALKKDIADATTRFAGLAEAMEKRIATLEAQPMPAKARVAAITKGAGADGGSDGPSSGEAFAEAQKALESMNPQERALFLMKLSLANPVSVIK